MAGRKRKKELWLASCDIFLPSSINTESKLACNNRHTQHSQQVPRATDPKKGKGFHRAHLARAGHNIEGEEKPYVVTKVNYALGKVPIKFSLTGSPTLRATQCNVVECGLRSMLIACVLRNDSTGFHPLPFQKA